MDLGADRRGVDIGPSAIRYGGFADHKWAHTSAMSEESVVIVSVDDGERRLIAESDITAYTMSDIDAWSMPEIVDEALGIATDRTNGIRISLDLDRLDSTKAPGVGTPVRDGVSHREAHIGMEYVAKHHDQLRSTEIVEVNPILGEHNRTAELGCEFVASVFGKYVL